MLKCVAYFAFAFAHRVVPIEWGEWEVGVSGTARQLSDTTLLRIHGLRTDTSLTTRGFTNVIYTNF